MFRKTALPSLALAALIGGFALLPSSLLAQTSPAAASAAGACPQTPVILDQRGEHTLPRPVGCSRVIAELWSAGGGSGAASPRFAGGNGAAGSYLSGEVDLGSATNLVVWVGYGGDPGQGGEPAALSVGSTLALAVGGGGAGGSAGDDGAGGDGGVADSAGSPGTGAVPGDGGPAGRLRGASPRATPIGVDAKTLPAGVMGAPPDGVRGGPGGSWPAGEVVPGTLRSGNGGGGGGGLTGAGGGSAGASGGGGGGGGGGTTYADQSVHNTVLEYGTGQHPGGTGKATWNRKAGIGARAPQPGEVPQAGGDGLVILHFR